MVGRSVERKLVDLQQLTLQRAFLNSDPLASLRAVEIHIFQCVAFVNTTQNARIHASGTIGSLDNKEKNCENHFTVFRCKFSSYEH